MKSKNTLIVTGVLVLAFTTFASAFVWNDIAFAAKLGMYAFGFSSGVIAGILITMRKEAFGSE